MELAGFVMFALVRASLARQPEQTRDRDILVDVRPVYASASAHQLPAFPLSWSRRQEARKPGKRDAQLAAVGQSYD